MKSLTKCSDKKLRVVEHMLMRIHRKTGRACSFYCGANVIKMTQQRSNYRTLHLTLCFAHGILCFIVRNF